MIKFLVRKVFLVSSDVSFLNWSMLTQQNKEFFFYLFIHLFNVGKVRYTVPVCCKKSSFPYKNKMLIKANGAIKSIMHTNVKTNKLNFRAKIMNKTNFFITATNY